MRKKRAQFASDGRVPSRFFLFSVFYDVCGCEVSREKRVEVVFLSGKSEENTLPLHVENRQHGRAEV